VSSENLAAFVGLSAIVGAIALFVVQVLIAIALGADAKDRAERSKPVAFFGPGLWFLAAVFGGFVVLALYWVMHYSSLRRPEEFPGQP